jgi:hypothetical protein
MAVWFAKCVFHPKENSNSGAQSASAVVSEDGCFVLGSRAESDGALAGTYVITVCMTRGFGMVNDPAAMPSQFLLPARYAKRQTTPLTATVQARAMELPAFELYK